MCYFQCLWVINININIIIIIIIIILLVHDVFFKENLFWLPERRYPGILQTFRRPDILRSKVVTEIICRTYS